MPVGTPVDSQLMYMRIAFISDESTASGAHPQRPDATAEGMILGTPDYIAPEQTGRMNRSIDGRADLVDRSLAFIYGLLALSIVIAVFGIVLTLLLAVYERRGPVLRAAVVVAVEA